MLSFGFVVTLIAAVCGCGGSSGSSSTAITSATVTAPVVAMQAAQAGAQIVSLSTTTSGATIYYTIDGTTPTPSSIIYAAPFLVASNLTIKAYAAHSGQTDSAVTTQTLSPGIPSGTLVWSDEFTNTTGSNQQPNPSIWTYDTGNSGFGNHELENYCAWGSTAAPCDPNHPNAYVGTDGYLHIVAQQSGAGVYTSARMKTQGLFSVQYGRLEARIWVPEAQGLWPAFWTLGNNINQVDWPACGEQDIMERVNAATTPDWNEGSVHGTGFTGGTGLGTVFHFPSGQVAAGWHTYGIIWSRGSIAYYVDDPTKPYVTYTNPASITSFPGAVWPFDSGTSNFIILNLAIGGDWPGNPNSATSFPQSLLVDYVRFYAP